MPEATRMRASFVAGMLLLSLFALALAARPAAAAEPVGARVKTFTAVPSSTQAGGHPDLKVDFTIGSRIDPVVLEENGANTVRNAMVETPGGFIGNPHAVESCTSQQFQADRCPPDSQVGTALPDVLVNEGTGVVLNLEPVYNLEPEPGQAGLLAFKASNFNFPNYIVLSARTDGDYGLNAESRGITSFFALVGFHMVLWGVPAAPIHDAFRFTYGGGFPGGNPSSSNLPERAFLSMPTTCAGPLKATLKTLAYDGGEKEGSTVWPATTGCDQLNFNPSLSAKPSTTQADTATGLDVVLKVPQYESPETPSASEIKETRVTLPEGFSINPSAADGKVSCSDLQAHIKDRTEAQCPQEAKVGTLSIDSWALPDPIPGAIYLGDPLPGDRYRLILTADGFGTHIKLPGSVHADPRTGQLTAEFVNLPQAPLTQFDMHFFGSERGLLATPAKCGTYAVQSEFVPWATELPNQTSTQFFKIDSGPNGGPCPGVVRPFGPAFRAVGATNGAGAHGAFSVNIDRPDGDQTLSTIGVSTPPGFSATLKGVPACPEATLREIESPGWSGLAEGWAPKCPAASQVGVSTAGAGAGSRPFYAPGKVYLGGPYKGAPLSFAVVTPAVSGPYDLGNVVNRVAVKVNPSTATVTAVSDPLPQIIEGVPLRLRSVLINLDRKDFTINPTNCSPFAVTGILTGDQGAGASPQNHFQVANCDGLGFEPKLRLSLAGATKRTGNPALTAVLTQPEGEANISRAVVSLPHSEFLDQAHLANICTRVQFAADQCPPRSVYGSASVVTPLLDQPLRGPVYLRSNPEHELPDLVAALRGPASQPIAIELVGRIDSFNEGIRTTFESVPDAPVTKFVLAMKGGSHGLLKNSTNLCRGRHYVDAKILGQNGERANQRPELVAKGCKGGAAKKKRTAAKKRRAR